MSEGEIVEVLRLISSMFLEGFHCPLVFLMVSIGYGGLAFCGYWAVSDFVICGQKMGWGEVLVGGLCYNVRILSGVGVNPHRRLRARAEVFG